MDKLFYFTEKLESLNIPFIGISISPNKIDFKPEATQDQIALANTLLSTIDNDFYLASTIKTIKSEANKQIEKYYPQYKRENILDLAQGYTDADRIKFRAFRDSIRLRSSSYEQSVLNGNSVIIDYSDLTP